MHLKKFLPAAAAAAAVAVAVVTSAVTNDVATSPHTVEAAAQEDTKTRWLKESADQPQSDEPPAVPDLVDGSPALRADAERVQRHLPAFAVVRTVLLTFAGDGRHAHFEFTNGDTTVHVFVDTLRNSRGVRLDRSDRVEELAVDARGRELAVVRSVDALTVEVAERSGRHVRVVLDGVQTLTLDDLKALAATALGSASA